VLRVYGCIADHHDIRLVILAGLICLFSCYTAFSLIARARQPDKPSAYRWLFAAAIVTGCGIWATHFVAMLGFDPGLPLGYDIALTALSALIAVAASGLGFAVGVRKGRAALGGAIAGAAISAMHYVGMAGVHLQAREHWDVVYIAASIAIGVGFGAAAFVAARRITALRGLAVGTLLLTLGICGMHFTGMAALSFTPDPTLAVPKQTILPLFLSVAITAITVLIVSFGLVGALVDQHVSEIEAAKRELESTAAQLQRALVAADAANYAKSQFLATMSHELRTPLNAVIGFAELLKNETLGPVGCEQYRNYAADIFNSGKHLLGMINDILDLAKLDSGHLELSEEVVDLKEAVNACLRIVEPQAEKAQVRLSAALEAHLPRLRADSRRLKQILINLLSNAVKFTPEGGSITVSAACCDGGVVLRVADTGIGIAPEDMPTALARFGQIDSAFSRKYEGSGLGLPLVKQLVELHGGTLSIESEVGVGTIVSVFFPAERVITLREVA
jgi:signal transduction histidine kinase